VDWRAHAESRLPAEYLDANGDLAPPWERFPDYERYTIGWRMGPGEDWLGLWSVFLDKLGTDPAARLAYLRRHAPAPVTWAGRVHFVLNPTDESEEYDWEDDTRRERIEALTQQGLVASDIAFSTWSRQHPDYLPWEDVRSPIKAARYRTRELWFWSRQMNERRGKPDWAPPALPLRWRACATPLKSGTATRLDVHKGLLSLARVLAAGRVVPPWELGLSPDDFADSFEDDMGYVDAFRLWGMSALDDKKQLESLLPTASTPEEWRPWIAKHFPGE